MRTRRFATPLSLLLMLAACSGSSGVPPPVTADAAADEPAALDTPARDATDDDVALADLVTPPDRVGADDVIDVVDAHDVTDAHDVADAAATVGPYPAGPYGNREGDVLANLSWEGYTNLAGRAVSTTLPYGPTSMQAVRETGRRYGIVHVSEFY